MKYQIYLKKETSEMVNKMAQIAGTTPSHMLKILFEDMAIKMLPKLGDILDELQEATNDLAKRAKQQTSNNY